MYRAKEPAADAAAAAAEDSIDSDISMEADRGSHHGAATATRRYQNPNLTSVAGEDASAGASASHWRRNRSATNVRQARRRRISRSDNDDRAATNIVRSSSGGGGHGESAYGNAAADDDDDDEHDNSDARRSGRWGLAVIASDSGTRRDRQLPSTSSQHRRAITILNRPRPFQPGFLAEQDQHIRGIDSDTDTDENETTGRQSCDSFDSSPPREAARDLASGGLSPSLEVSTSSSKRQQQQQNKELDDQVDQDSIDVQQQEEELELRERTQASGKEDQELEIRFIDNKSPVSTPTPGGSEIRLPTPSAVERLSEQQQQQRQQFKRQRAIKQPSQPRSASGTTPPTTVTYFARPVEIAERSWYFTDDNEQDTHRVLRDNEPGTKQHEPILLGGSASNLPSVSPAVARLTSTGGRQLLAASGSEQRRLRTPAVSRSWWNLSRAASGEHRARQEQSPDQHTRTSSGLGRSSSSSRVSPQLASSLRPTATTTSPAAGASYLSQGGGGHLSPAFSTISNDSLFSPPNAAGLAAYSSGALYDESSFSHKHQPILGGSRWTRRRGAKRPYPVALSQPSLLFNSSTSSVFALYALRYAYDKFQLALRAFRQWYHENLTYHKLSHRMEYDRHRFERWYKSKGRPLSLRALDHYDRVVIWIADERDVIQKRTFTKWINKYLLRRGKQMQDLFQDLRDGQNLITLLEMLSGQQLPRERGRMRVHQLQNIQIALNYIKFRKVKLVNIRPEDIVDGNQKLTLGLIWTIILHFQLEDNSNFREILLRWAQKTTDGYPGCNVTDLTTSWRDGLAFNAIIHRNRPDLLDYRACKKKTSKENLEQAFCVADRDLNVARLLEPEDVDVPCPDEKSMITYLAQLYELFPDPPERNPLLDEEKLRRIDEYKELASRLLKWIRDSTTKLDDRRFPKTIPELKKLKDEVEKFRTQEVPPKQHDKERLAAVAREVYKFAHDLNVKVPDDLHIDNIDYHWDRMMNALKARNKALDDEIAKADRLRALLDKLLTDIKKTNERLDGIEGRMNDEERRISRLESLRDAEAYSPLVFQKISEDLADCGIKIDAIKRLAEEFCNENGRTAPDSIMIREKVAELDGRYKKLLGRLGRLNDQYAQTLERLRNMDNEMRRAQARKEAEAKLRLRLEEMKRQLDELERRIDNMGPVAKDIATLQRQLAELHEFDKDLNKARNNLNDLIGFAEKLIADDLIADPVSLRSNLQALKDQLARIEEKAARRLRDFEQALEHAERQKKAEAEINLKLDGIKKELDELERRIDNMKPVGKDFATLKRQLEELKDFEQDLGKTRRNLNDVVRLAEDMIRDDLISDPAKLRANINTLKDQLARIDEKVARRLRAIKDALNRAEAQKEAEERFNMRLDAIKKELDDLERRIDSMAPVAKDLGTLQQQLAEMQDFNERLNKTRGNLNDVIKAGEDLIREDLIADPAALRNNMKALKDQLARIEDKAAKRLKEITDAMGKVAASDAIQDVAKWLAHAKKVLVNEENVHGDLDTVNALIEQHKSFQQEIQAQQPAINEVRRMEKELSSASPQTGAAIREELNDLSNQWREVEKLTREKSAKLEDALRAAEQMHDSVHSLLEWLADAEMKLRFAGTMPEDEKATTQELGDHEKFMRKLASQGQTKDQTLKLARDILTKCHPDAEPVIKHWINIIQSRWEEIDAWAKQRGQRLADHLRSLTELLELVEELIGWLTRHEGRLLGEETEQLPINANQLESMIDAHATFMDELRKHEPDVDRVVKIFASKAPTATSKTVVTTTTTKPRGPETKSTTSGRLSGGARSATPTRTSYATYRDEYPEVRHPRARIMLEKWRSVWQLSLDKMQRLKDRVEHLKEMERLENFDFDQWRRRFLTWVNANKGRVMDFFRSIDDDNDGRVPIEAFISGVLRSKFETSRLEMERVADIFDKNNDGTVDNKEYLDSLRPDKPITDDELIQDEVQRQVSKCTCPQRYRVYHVGEGRYRFGESQKLRLVRILRSTVMVRVGGGWEPLTSFLQKNDPCRAKGRTNVELREQFILPEGASQAMATFKSKMSRDPSSVPVLGPITKIREKTDRSMPMSGSRYGSPSDYYSESESTSKTKSRIDRLTPASTSSRPSSRPVSRHGSDLAFNLDPKPTSRSTDNLR